MAKALVELGKCLNYKVEEAEHRYHSSLVYHDAASTFFTAKTIASGSLIYSLSPGMTNRQCMPGAGDNGFNEDLLESNTDQHANPAFNQTK